MPNNAALAASCVVPMLLLVANIVFRHRRAYRGWVMAAGADISLGLLGILLALIMMGVLRPLQFGNGRQVRFVLVAIPLAAWDLLTYAIAMRFEQSLLDAQREGERFRWIGFTLICVLVVATFAVHVIFLTRVMS